MIQRAASPNDGTGAQDRAMYRLKTEFCGDAKKATRRRPADGVLRLGHGLHVIAPSDNQTREIISA